MIVTLLTITAESLALVVPTPAAGQGAAESGPFQGKWEFNGKDNTGLVWSGTLSIGKRVFYSSHLDKITNYNVTVPGKAGFSCSSQVTFSPATTDDVAKIIALSVAPVK